MNSVILANGSAAVSFLKHHDFSVRLFKGKCVFTADPEVHRLCSTLSLKSVFIELNNLAHGTFSDFSEINKLSRMIEEEAMEGFTYKGVDLFKVSSYELARYVHYSTQVSKLFKEKIGKSAVSNFLIIGVSGKPLIENTFLGFAKAIGVPVYYLLNSGFIGMTECRHLLKNVNWVLCPDSDIGERLCCAGISTGVAWPVDSTGYNHRVLCNDRYVLAAPGVGGHVAKFVQDILKVATYFPELKFVLSFHPSYDTKGTDCLMEDGVCPDNVLIRFGGSDEFIESALAVLTDCSFQITLASFLKGIPVIFYLIENNRLGLKLFKSKEELLASLFTSASVDNIVANLESIFMGGSLIKRKVGRARRYVDGNYPDFIFYPQFLGMVSVAELFSDRLQHMKGHYKKNLTDLGCLKKCKDKKDILIFASYSVVLETCFPVARRLEAFGYSILFCTTYTGLKPVHSEGFEAVTCDIEREGVNSLNSDYFEEGIIEGVRTLFLNKKFCLGDAESAMLNLELIIKKGVQNVNYILELLDCHTPRLILLDSTITPFPLIISQIAYNRGIPVLAFEHGLEYPWVFERTSSNYSGMFAALGDYSAEHLRKYGFDSNKLKITGLTRQVGNGNGNRKSKSRCMPLSAEDNYILFAPICVSETPELRQWTIEFIKGTFMRVCGELGMKAMVKPHPFDSVDCFASSIKNGDVIFVDEKEDIEMYIKGARCIVTFFSTVIFTAVRMNIPVVQLHFDKEHCLLDISDNRLVFSASNEESLLDILAEVAVNGPVIRDKEVAEKFCRYYLGPPYSESLSKMVSYCRELLCSR